MRSLTKASIGFIHGQFKPEAASNPTIGESGKLEYVDEYVIECIFDGRDQNAVTDAVRKFHPYEEPAYDIYSLDRKADTGLGVTFEYGDTLDSLVKLIETKTGLTTVNVVKADDRIIKTAAIIGGSGVRYSEAAV